MEQDKTRIERLYDYYHPIGADSFFINSSCVLAESHIVTTGSSYILFEYIEGRIIKVLPVSLKKVLVINGEIYFFFIDMFTRNVVSRKSTECNRQSKRQWKICDLDFIINRNNLSDIQLATPSNSCIPNRDELLDFEF